MKNKSSIETIEINGAEVELHWGEGSAGVGLAVHAQPSNAVGEAGPCDGATFELRGKKYDIGQHHYSTDQPGCEDDAECTCSAAIYEVAE